MLDRPTSRWKRYRSWRKAHSRVARISLRLAEIIFVLVLLGTIFAGFRGFAWTFVVLLGILLIPFLLVLLGRWLSRRVLWKVRNRLIVTYILMGLAPIVLFGTLTAIASYFLAGQYEANVALIPIHEAEEEVTHEASGVAVFLLLHGRAPVNSARINTGTTTDADVSVALLENNHWKPLAEPSEWSSAAKNPLLMVPPPAWIHPGFQGIVSLHQKLYLVSVRSATQGSSTVTALASMPLDNGRLDTMARPLGRVRLTEGMFGGDDVVDEKAPVHVSENRNDGVRVIDNKPVFADTADNSDNKADDKAPPPPRSDAPDAPATSPAASKPGKLAAAKSTQAQESTQPQKPASDDEDEESFRSVRGGAVPPSTHFYDTRLIFAAPVPIIAWTSGHHIPALVHVTSRATVLYAQLFATAANVGLIVRIGLISIASVFAFIELLALWMAVVMSRTITRSVADLYEATSQIDRGNLEHRVVVKQKDQLGALAISFNRMAASLQDLLVKQRENDRLLNELAIAQEVQRNLFPASPVSLPGLDLHAVCIPARTVSGDYFDFIFGPDGSGGSFHTANTALHTSTNGNENGTCKLCIALGDISGKGISAALLMASLNSAVRAFSLGEGAAAGPDGCPSPARLLALLNRHLYRSTQPEKYATLFLAFYDTENRMLTYSNAGHLPPFVLSDYKPIRRLDCGGPVVGLLDGLEYVEATVELEPGDLLMAYSDGLTEPENETGEFGEQRLIDCIWEQRQQPLPAVASHTLRTLQTWIGTNEQPDDMTILLARAL